MLLSRSDLDSEYQTQQLNISAIPTISIVDDDESVRDALESLLKSVGYRTEVFASAEDFLRSGPHEETKCVILDIRMPGMSGLELQRRLVAAGSRVRIIFVTAHADEEGRARVVSAGAVACLRKPFNDDVLLRAVESALQS
jgi:FixJ family two-component response regulator